MNRLRSPSMALSVLIAAHLIFFLSEIANAIALGYMTGNEYLKLSERERVYWFIGVIDGLAAEQLLSPKKNSGSKNSDGKDDPSDRVWISDCISRFPIEQLHAIFEKELKETPESWHAPAALVARGEFEKMCQRGKW
jgi:hypothetical protein